MLGVCHTKGLALLLILFHKNKISSQTKWKKVKQRIITWYGSSICVQYACLVLVVLLIILRVLWNKMQKEHPVKLSLILTTGTGRYYFQWTMGTAEFCQRMEWLHTVLCQTFRDLIPWMEKVLYKLELLALASWKSQMHFAVSPGSNAERIAMIGHSMVILFSSQTLSEPGMDSHWLCTPQTPFQKKLELVYMLSCSRMRAMFYYCLCRMLVGEGGQGELHWTGAKIVPHAKKM